VFLVSPFDWSWAHHSLVRRFETLEQAIAAIVEESTVETANGPRPYRFDLAADVSELPGRSAIDWRAAIITLTGSTRSPVDWRQALLDHINSSRSPVDWKAALESAYPGKRWYDGLILALGGTPENPSP
jgi:hypothetical protein